MVNPKETTQSTTLDNTDNSSALSRALSRIVYPELVIPFVLLVLCFASWGAAANLTDILVGVFKRIFDMSNFQSALVQFSYYGAYFLLAIPAAYINKRFGYKCGVLTGLGLAAMGGFLFIPASNMLVYEMFLLALFVLAAGLSILETSANPFVIAMGPEQSGTQRLNLAQAFNPVGANVGVLLGALLIVPRLTTENDKAGATAEQLLEYQKYDLSLTLGPYIGIATVLLIIWLLILFRRMNTPQEQAEHELRKQRKAGGVTTIEGGTLTRLWQNRHYRYGVLAQFFNVAAQTCTWTFTIQYASEAAGVEAAYSGWYLQGSLVLFLFSRFLMTWLLGIIRPARLLMIMATLGVALALFAAFTGNFAGLLAVVGISASLSLMFPTIYGIALSGLGEDTKYGAAGLVMAILGGALLPLVHGAIADIGGHAIAYIVPAACLAVVAGYAIFDLRNPPHKQAKAV